MRSLLLFTVAATTATTLEAQMSCASPGGAFGVTTIQCTNCLLQQKGDTVRWLFQAEPIVIAVEDKPLIIIDGAASDAKTALRSGDIIEAINGKPITTAAGSKEFSAPPAGESRIAVRRGRKRETITAQAQSCASDRLTVTGSALETRRDSSGNNLLARNRAQIATVAPPAKASATQLKILTAHLTPRQGEVFVESETYGFAVSCFPHCSKAIPSGNSPSYYMLSGDVKIVAIDDDSPLKSIGVKVGDAIIEVNGGGFTSGESAAAKTLSWLDHYPQVRLKIRFQNGTVGLYELRAPGR